MNTNEPFDLSLPTPGCYLDPEKAGMDSDAVFQGMTAHLFYTLGKLATSASPHDLYMALSYAVKDRLMTRYLASQEVIRKKPQKTVAYLSAEFLIGPQLSNNLLNLGITQEAEDGIRDRSPSRGLGDVYKRQLMTSWLAKYLVISLSFTA